MRELNLLNRPTLNRGERTRKLDKDQHKSSLPHFCLLFALFFLLSQL